MKILIFLTLIFCVNAKITQTLDRSPKIVGGESAEIEEFPSLVAMININNNPPSQRCAGTIISEYWVLTCAHCYISPQLFVLEHSTANLRLTGEGAKFFYPELYTIHEKYNGSSITFDIGLIKTKDVMYTGLHVPFAKLASPGNYYPTGTPATVAGWGIWNYDNRTLPQLQKADLQIWHYRDCQEAHRYSNSSLRIHSHQICAGLPDFSKAECNGDSGGPLLVHGVQVGIVSWSLKPCTVAEYPGVYTEVSFFIPWIQEKTGLNFEIQQFLIRKK